MKITAAAVLFNEDATKVLLGQRVDNNRWALIGGHVDEHETSEPALRRELDEEIGISPEILVPVCFFEDEHPGGYTALVLVYTGVLKSDSIILNKEPEKNLRLRWWHLWDLHSANPWCGFNIIRKCQAAMLTAP